MFQEIQKLQADYLPLRKYPQGRIEMLCLSEDFVIFKGDTNLD